MSTQERTVSLRTIVRALTPPAVVSLKHRVNDMFTAPDFEVVAAESVTSWDSDFSGWNTRSVAETNLRKWPLFERAVAGTGALGIAHEAPSISTESASAHNSILTFGYVLARAAISGQAVSVLDWGGGIGHYFVLAEALLPEVDIEYHCKDVPALCEVGREVLPRAQFYDDDSCLSRKYDVVMASSSLHYSEDWRETLGRLAQAANRLLYVTRLPIVQESPTFLMVQRPQRFGYNTELIGRVLNRSDFLSAGEAAGLTLLREFIVTEEYRIRGASEPAHTRGFIFAPALSP